MRKRSVLNVNAVNNFQKKEVYSVMKIQYTLKLKRFSSVNAVNNLQTKEVYSVMNIQYMLKLKRFSNVNFVISKLVEKTI